MNQQFIDCVRNNDVEGVIKALGNGANVQHKKGAALKYVVENKNAEMVTTLLKRGANVHGQDCQIE